MAGHGWEEKYDGQWVVAAGIKNCLGLDTRWKHEGQSFFAVRNGRAKKWPRDTGNNNGRAMTQTGINQTKTNDMVGEV